MTDTTLAVRRQVTIVRQYNGIGITGRRQGYHLPTATPLTPRFYNGRIAYRYKGLRVGLATLRKQARCSVALTVVAPGLPC